jgi:hypothetical protein
MEDERERRGLGTQMGRREVYGIGEERKGWLFKPYCLTNYQECFYPAFWLSYIYNTFNLILQRKGMGREKKGRKGKEGKRKEMTWPPNKIPGSATDSQCAAKGPVYLTNVVILKMLSTS